MSEAVVWTIAGSDCSGGAGIQADLLTFRSFHVHGCSVTTALTAQNSEKTSAIDFCSSEMLDAQLEALSKDYPPRAIKLGMIGSLTTLKHLLPYLKQFPRAIIYDPVLFTSTGWALHEENCREFLIEHILPLITLLTPNIPEAEWLLGQKITNNQEMEEAANALLRLGPCSILLKGGHATSQMGMAEDVWTDGQERLWLKSTRLSSQNSRGTGCTLSSAIAACLALEYDLKSALVLAKAYVHQGIRLAKMCGTQTMILAHAGFPETEEDFPIMTTHVPFNSPPNLAFPSCGEMPLGLYPIVSEVACIEPLLKKGITTIQLRIKDKPLAELEEMISQAIAIANQYQARLFINDHWQLALKLGAYGVHLGQEDLNAAPCERLQQAGLRLGISSHSYAEMARARAYKPSYIAYGPIFHTITKEMQASPQGLKRLAQYCRTFTCPIVAIGGIKWEDLPNICKAGTSGVAVITAIRDASHPLLEAERWIQFISRNHYAHSITA